MGAKGLLIVSLVAGWNCVLVNIMYAVIIVPVLLHIKDNKMLSLYFDLLFFQNFVLYSLGLTLSQGCRINSLFYIPLIIMSKTPEIGLLRRGGYPLRSGGLRMMEDR